MACEVCRAARAADEGQMGCAGTVHPHKRTRSLGLIVALCGREQRVRQAWAAQAFSARARGRSRFDPQLLPPPPPVQGSRDYYPLSNASMRTSRQGPCDTAQLSTWCVSQDREPTKKHTKPGNTTGVLQRTSTRGRGIGVRSIAISSSSQNLVTSPSVVSHAVMSRTCPDACSQT